MSLHQMILVAEAIVIFCCWVMDEASYLPSVHTDWIKSCIVLSWYVCDVYQFDKFVLLY